MANEIKIKVTSEADTSGINKAKGDLDKLKISAKESGAEVDKLSKNMTESDRIGSMFGEKLKASAAKNKVKSDDILDLKPNPGVFAKFGSMLSDGLGGVSKLAGNQVGLTIGASAAVAAAPVLISSLGALLAASAGIGVIGLGVMRAIQKDESLQSAGKEMTKRLAAGISKGSDAFTQPIREGMDHIAQYGDRLGSKLSTAFGKLSGSVVPLVDRIIQFGESISDVLIKKATEAGPALDAFGDGLAMLGDSLAGVLDTLIDTGPQAADNLRLLLGGLGDFIEVSVQGIKVISDLGNKFEWATGVIPFLRDHYKDAAGAADELSSKESTLAESMTAAQRAADGQRTALSALSAEMKAETDPVFGLLNAQKKLKAAQDAYSSAVKKSGKNSDDAKAALRDLATASIDLEGKAGALGEKFDGNVSPALHDTLRAAGMTEGQIRDLGRQFKSAQRAGDQFAKNYKAAARVDGAAQSKAAIQSLTRAARAYEGVWTATMVTNYVMHGMPNSPGAFGGRVMTGLATGGIAGAGAAADGSTSGGLTWVGENGPELAQLPAGTRVWSAGDSQRMSSQMGGGGGGDFTLSLAPNITDKFMAVIVEQLRYEVNRSGGGSVQRLLGRAGVR